MIISDYFNIEYGQRKYTSKGYLKEKKGKIPLISSKGTENGVYGFFDIKSKYEHVISVPRTGTICHAFYQEWKCCIDDNCLVLIPKKKLNSQKMIYLSLLIRKEKFRYMYGRQVTPERLGKTKVPSDFPEFIQTKFNFNFTNISNSYLNKQTNLKDKNWKYFIYEELFDVVKGKRVVMSGLEKGKFNFVSAIDSNNGVSFRSNITPLFKENTITVNYDGNGVGLAFYQNKPYWALDSVNVLIPKFALNPYIGMFLITIKRFRKNYAIALEYGRDFMYCSIKFQSGFPDGSTGNFNLLFCILSLCHFLP